MKRIILLSLLVVLFLGFCGCAEIPMQLNTEFSFDREKVFLLSDDYLIYQQNDEQTVYQLIRHRAKVRKYYTIPGDLSVADFRDGLLLLNSVDKLVCCNVAEKKSYDWFDKVFSPEEISSGVRYRAFFLNREKLVVTKILTDLKRPIKSGGIKLGYSIAPESGVYVYSIDEEKLSLDCSFTLKQLDFTYNEYSDLTFVGGALSTGKISLMVLEKSLVAGFSNQYFYTIDLESKSLKQIGKYLLQENQDTLLQYAFTQDRALIVNSKQVLCADFVKEKTYRFGYKLDGKVTSINVLEQSQSDVFFVELSTENTSLLYRLTEQQKELECEVANNTMLSTIPLIQNGFLRSNNLYFPSDAEARLYGDLFVNGTAYRSFAQNGYLCDNNGKVTVVFSER